MLVSASSGNRVELLDDRPALDVYLERLNAPTEAHTGRAAAFTEFAQTHPLGLARRSGEEHVRFVSEADFEKRALVCIAEVPQGGLTWLMEGDATSVLDATDAACMEALDELAGRKPIGMLTFDCIARKGVLGVGVGDEVARVADHAGTRAGGRLLHVRRDRANTRRFGLPQPDPRRPRRQLSSGTRMNGWSTQQLTEFLAAIGAAKNRPAAMRLAAGTGRGLGRGRGRGDRYRRPGRRADRLSGRRRAARPRRAGSPATPSRSRLEGLGTCRIPGGRAGRRTKRLAGRGTRRGGAVRGRGSCAAARHGPHPVDYAAQPGAAHPRACGAHRDTAPGGRDPPAPDACSRHSAASSA